MGDIHLTGDTHFFHYNKFGGILAYAHRPFPDIKTHNECIVDNWNSQVKVGDTVIIDGDLSFGSVSKTKDILRQLHGKKIMVVGDHDKQVWQCREFFEEITPYKTITVGKHFIAIFHWCIRNWQRSHYNSYHAYAHSEKPSVIESIKYKLWYMWQMKDYHAYAHSHGGLLPIGKSWDVGVDTECDFGDIKHERFFPYHIDEFLKIMEHRPNNPNYIKDRKKK